MVEPEKYDLADASWSHLLLTAKVSVKRPTYTNIIQGMEFQGQAPKIKFRCLPICFNQMKFLFLQN